VELGCYLNSLGLAGGITAISELAGGVSSTVLAVDIGTRPLVVKQALPRLKVAAPWFASPLRSRTETEVLNAVARVSPTSVPEVVTSDPDNAVIVMTRAPASWRSWRDRLFEQEFDPAVGGALGRLLAEWHRMSFPDSDDTLSPRAAFEELRIEPFYQAIAARHPDDARAVLRCADMLNAGGRGLVHGDFSPKNFLVGRVADGPGLWVLDWEVAHPGDGTFDVAFLLSHLLLKAIVMSSNAGRVLGIADAFCDAYSRSQGGDLCWTNVFAHVGCLLIARVDGKSPAPYLDDAQRATARRLGRRLLYEPVKVPAQAWQLLDADSLGREI